MAEYALLYPSAIASFIPLPARISSLIRSKIRTLASTAIPIVRTIPAIPGNVRTALREARTPSIRKMFPNRAISAINPALRL